MFFKDMTRNALGRITTRLERLDWSFTWTQTPKGNVTVTVYHWQENIEGEQTLVTETFDNEHELNLYIEGY